jgi:hypothetical protein
MRGWGVTEILPPLPLLGKEGLCVNKNARRSGELSGTSDVGHRSIGMARFQILESAARGRETLSVGRSGCVGQPTFVALRARQVARKTAFATRRWYASGCVIREASPAYSNSRKSTGKPRSISTSASSSSQALLPGTPLFPRYGRGRIP